MTVEYERRQRRSKKSHQLYLNYQDSNINLDTYPRWDFIFAFLYFNSIGALLSEYQSHLINYILTKSLHIIVDLLFCSNHIQISASTV